MGHEEDIKIINAFVGRDCERTLACNSIKLRFAEKGQYIWIDPPWFLDNSSGTVMRSDEYPGDAGEFEEWSEGMNPLNYVRLTSFEYRRGSLVLSFNTEHKLIVPPSLAEVTQEDFYHHWYASSE